MGSATSEFVMQKAIIPPVRAKLSDNFGFSRSEKFLLLFSKRSARWLASQKKKARSFS
jgi:hypothetical protein